MNISFAYPASFWLFAIIPLLILLWFWYKRWHLRAEKRIGNPLLVRELMKGYSRRKNNIRFGFLLVLVALTILTLAGPQNEGAGEPDERKGIDLVLALDVSKSMLATDLAPSRLQNAKAFLKEVVRKRPDDRIGLILFAGHAYTQLPLTYDHSSAQLFIDNADPASFSAQGTAIADALAKSRDLLVAEKKRFRVTLLLTDGETFDQDAKDGNAKFWTNECAKNGIMVITVGMGSTGGSTIIDPVTHIVKKDRNGNVVTSSLNTALLEEIASGTQGIFVHFKDPAVTEKQVTDQLANVKQTTLVDRSLLSYNSLYLWLAIPLVFLLVIDFFIPERKQITAT